MKVIYSGGYIPDLALQDEKDKPMFGCLFYKHPDGQWVSLSGEYKNILTQLTSARSRIEELEETLQDIAYYDMTDGEKLKDPIDVVGSLCSIARQALSGKEPVEPKEVSVDALKNELRRLFNNFEVGDGKTFGFNYIAHRLFAKYTIKEKT